MPNRALIAVVGLITLGLTGYFLLSPNKQRQTQTYISSNPETSQIRTDSDQEVSAPDLGPVEKQISLQKVQLVKEILASRNDNDPRMDTELKDLSEDAKRELISLYHSTKPEDRNGRGTIVFLLGRNIRSSDDFKFFQEVVTEAPCLSLNDCGSLPKRSDFKDMHADGSEEVTLHYPKLVALSSMENLLKQQKLSKDVQDELATTLKLASQDAEERVSSKASALLEKLNNTR